MKYKSTWILFTVLIAIAAYYFLVEEKARIAEERRLRDARYILPYTRDEIDRFVLVNPTGDRIELEKQGSSWMIVSPVLTDAAQSTIDALLVQLLPGRRLELFSGVTDLSRYGLEEPYATIIFYPSAGGEPDTLYVGDKTPTSVSCYVRIGLSDTVMIAREMTHNVVNKNLYHLRDKNFFYVSASTIDSLRIESGGRALTLARKGSGWWMNEPGAWADNMFVETYLNDLTLGIIRGFAREDTDSLEVYGLGPPRGSITVYRAGEETLISFGAVDEDQVHVVRTGIDKVLLIEEKLRAPLGWTLDEVRSRNLSLFEPADVSEIVCETQNRTITLLREHTGWAVSGVPIELEKPLNILRIISDLRFESFTGVYEETAPVGGEALPLSVTLSGTQGGRIDRVVFYPSPAGSEEAASASSGRRGVIASGKRTEIERILSSL
jgi:hypothetical protein